MNRVAKKFARKLHTNFTQEVRLVTMQVFGHEGLIENTDLTDMTHCVVIGTDLYRMNKIKLEHLAGRKLINPLKWAEFLIALPLELISWAPICLINRMNAWLADHNKELRKLKADAHKKSPALADEEIATERTKIMAITIITFIPRVIADLLFLILHPIMQIALGLIRRILAPVNTIIRPLITMPRKEPVSFAIILSLTLITAGFLAFGLFTGGLSFAVGGVVLTATIGAKIGIIAAASALLFSLLKPVKDFLGMLKKIITAPDHNKGAVYIGENAKELIEHRKKYPHIPHYLNEFYQASYLEKDNTFRVVTKSANNLMGTGIPLRPSSKPRKVALLSDKDGRRFLNTIDDHDIKEYQHVKLFEPDAHGNNSTDKISRMLFGTRTALKKPQDQTVWDTIKLATGTEGLFDDLEYKTEPCQVRRIPFYQLHSHNDALKKDRAAKKTEKDAEQKQPDSAPSSSCC